MKKLKEQIKSLYKGLPIIRELYGIQRQLQNQKRMFHSFNSEMIRLQSFGLSNQERYGNPKRLLRYESQVCSQGGEDGVIQEIFRRIGTTIKTFVEIGVGNGSENNTAFLLSQGWKGFWIDGNPKFLNTINQRPDIDSNCLKHTVQFVTKENIAKIFDQLGVPVELDLLSIDIDQNTYYIWEGLASYKPRVIVTEYNAALPPEVDWKVNYDPRRVWDLTQNFGASLKSFEKLGSTLGYSLVGCSFHGVNAFFVRNDLLENHFETPFTAENHYEPPRYWMQHSRHHTRSILDRNNKD